MKEQLEAIRAGALAAIGGARDRRQSWRPSGSSTWAKREN